jgi:FdhD protein
MARAPGPPGVREASGEDIAALPGKLRELQRIYPETGGCHGAGLFDEAGSPLVVREDVGRHNAVDKVIGAALRGGTPTAGRTLVLSGRAGFELIQKAAAAGISLVVAVGAPSSLAVRLARDSAMTLVGFARDGRFNVYANSGRLIRG